ncbi:MAG: transcription antitermination factor NusB [Candidatus Pacebacteria bacterium]|jgi:N utilization substance protein B|nr:transcription antitermination factor NusB [Candidatus Paceibacterota bacterium]|tara:strand:- start:3326 stop:4252 length:927 start_codon:yes stop_codon:yes gene_type:complete
MSNRHLSRSIVLQTLFELDFNGLIGGKEKIKDLETALARVAEEFAPGMGDFSFVGQLLENIIDKQKDIDIIIEKAAPEWPIEKISIVDRNILRIGLYELLFSDKKEVPAKVAINEAIELAKTFGGESSGRFVNGVLGAVYKEIGEPGKDEVSKKKIKKKIEDIPYEKMPIERLGGAVVYAKDKKEIYLALVHDVFGHWTLSKGRIEKGEDEKKGTVREIKEELGIDIKIKEKLGENEYVANDPKIGKKRKQVTYFLSEAKFQDLTLGSSGGLDDAKWFKFSDILDLNFYDDILPIVTKAINILLKRKT